MLEELLKYDKIGTKDELLILLFQILSPNEYKRIDEVKTICLHHSYSFGSSFLGIIQLLQALDLIYIKEGFVILDKEISKYQPDDFFENSFLFERLFRFLRNAQILDSLFNYQNTKLDHDTLTYYIKESQIPLALNNFKKLLINTDFLFKKEDLQGVYFVNPIFNHFFNSNIIPLIKRFSTKKMISLMQLKESLALFEKYGEEAEEFVLLFELKRLFRHPNKQQVRIISKEFVNTGFDIESFDTPDSIVNDRLIEVKSFDRNISFYWSKNEIEAAKEFTDIYFLYLVDRSKISVDGYQPFIINNPYKNIFLSNNWRMTSDTYFVFKEEHANN